MKPPRNALGERYSVIGEQTEQIPDFRSNLSSALQANATTFAKQRGARHGIENRAVTECFPIKSVRAIQHHFVRMRTATLSLTGAVKHVHQRPSRATVRVGNQNNGVLAFLREVKSPNIELILSLWQFEAAAFEERHFLFRLG